MVSAIQFNTYWPIQKTTARRGSGLVVARLDCELMKPREAEYGAFWNAWI